MRVEGEETSGRRCEENWRFAKWGMTHCLDVRTGIDQLSAFSALCLFCGSYVVEVSVGLLGHHGICRFIVWIWCNYSDWIWVNEYDSSFKREYSSNELVDIRCTLEDQCDENIDNSKVTWAYWSPQQTISFMVPFMSIEWLDADSRGCLTFGPMWFLHNRRGWNRSTKFGLAPVLNVKTTECKEEWCTQTLKKTSWFRFWNKVTMLSSSVCISRSVVPASRYDKVSFWISTDVSV